MMRIRGLEVEPCDAVIQEKQHGEWVDFCTIKDDDDIGYALKMLDGTHSQFKGEFRIRIGGSCQKFMY